MKSSWKAGVTAVLGAFLLFSSPVTRADNNKPLSAMDKMYMRKAAQGNLAEIMTGNLALKRSKDARVRTLAQMLVKEHGMAQMELKKVAKTHNATLPQKPDAEQMAMYRMLSRLRGTAFDKAFLRGQIKAHNATIALVTKQINEGDDSHVREHAQKQYGPITAHTQHIYNTAGQFGLPVGQKRTASATAKP